MLAGNFRTTFPWANLLGTKKELKKKKVLVERNCKCLFIRFDKTFTFCEFWRRFDFFFLLFLKMYKCNILQIVQSKLVWKCQIIQFISHWAHTCSDVSKMKKMGSRRIQYIWPCGKHALSKLRTSWVQLIALKQATPNHFFFLSFFFLNWTLC